MLGKPHSRRFAHLYQHFSFRYLRLHFADQWSLERLAATYKVHRATVARWLSGARETLLSKMSERLGVELGLGPDEVQSLVGLLRSQLDLSLTRFG